MIVLFTDFGLTGPYLGQLSAVIHQHAPTERVINLFADAPVYNPRASAYLLNAYTADFPQNTVFLAVVDPGVGSSLRQPVIVKADGRWYVGPDNGLFNVIAARAKELEAWHITWQPEHLSATFHGRDLFAPLAAQLSYGQLPASEYRIQTTLVKWESSLLEVIYVDHYGNLITGVSAAEVAHTGHLVIAEQNIPRVRTFSDVPIGKPLCYENSNGLIEVAVNQGRADTFFNASLGTAVDIIC